MGNERKIQHTHKDCSCSQIKVIQYDLAYVNNN